MDKNYLTYPCKVMRITQNYNGTTSHKPHTTGNPKDYPFDEGGKDSGRDGLYCDCDEMKIVRTYGVGNGGTNALWVESTSKVHCADGTRDYACGMIIHPNDSDFKTLYVGKKFKRGDLICREGTDGATGNHLHISFGKGKIKGNGWVQNSKGKWVLNCTGGAYKPEDLFFIDPDFTKVISSGGLKFKELPKYEKGYYTITSETLNVRSGPHINYSKIPYAEFTASAKKQIKTLKGADYKKNHFVKGMKLKISKIEGNWGLAPTGWVCLDYCKKVR